LLTLRVHYEASGVALPDADVRATFEYADAHGPVIVTLGKTATSPYAACEATSQETPSEECLLALRTLAKGKLPPGGPEPETLLQMGSVEADGTLREGFRVPIKYLPASAVSFLSAAERRLSEYAESTTAVIRWRFGMPGRHRALSNPQYEIEIDGQRTALPYVVPRLDRPLAPQPYDAERKGWVQDFVASGGRQPLAHELYREAASQWQENPRSSLVVAVAAAEVGIKQAAAYLAPQTKWLLDELPSPPVAKILKDFLPTLRLPTFNGQPLAPVKEIRTNLQTAVEKRNDLIHTGLFDLTLDELSALLDAIKNLLWLLDVYAGHAWAFHHIDAGFQRPLLSSVGAGSATELVAGLVFIPPTG
jgi:hypothetical protein